MTPLLYLACPAGDRADSEKSLATADLSVVWADDVSSALAELQQRDLPVLLDLSDGTATLKAAQQIRVQRPGALLFAVADMRRPDMTTEAVLTGIADVFARPMRGCHVAAAIARERRYTATRAGRPLPAPEPSHSANLYCHSRSMRDVVAAIAAATGPRGGILITGEQGTGRQVAARALHAEHSGATNVFVTLDCATDKTDQLEAALFGADSSGAAASASRGMEQVGRSGRLCQALGGTLYLENVADAPTRFQARLARVLRDGEAVLEDTGQPIDINVRTIAAVEGNFDAVAGEGRVREDLFRRWSAIRIEMPPLRERREDIGALANCFLREISASLGVPAKMLSRPALSLITAMPWPGNAPQLRAVLHSIVTGLQGGRAIGLDDVLMNVRLDGRPAALSVGGTLKEARARFEKEYIAATLEQQRGRISDAARVLGIQRTNLYRKMRSLKVMRDGQ